MPSISVLESAGLSGSFGIHAAALLYVLPFSRTRRFRVLAIRIASWTGAVSMSCTGFKERKKRRQVSACNTQTLLLERSKVPTADD